MRDRVDAIRAIVLFFPFFLASPPSARAQDNTLPTRLERVVTLIRGDQITEAEEQLSYILKTTPNQADALNLLGAIRARQGRLEEAETLFKRAVDNNRRLVSARMNLAHLYSLKGMPDPAIMELKEILRLEPNNADAEYKLARLLLAQNRVDECIDFVESARGAASITSPLLVLLGDAYLKKSDLAKAEETYSVVLDRKDPDADALIGLAQVYQARGDIKATSAYLARAREAAANSPESLHRLSLVALNSELPDEARSAIELATRLRPEEPSYTFILGVAWLKKPDLVEAERVFRRFLERQAESAQGQLFLGYALLKQKKYPEAREWLERSVRTDTNRPETYYYLGLIAQEFNEDDRAIKLFEEAIRKSPSFAHAHVALGVTYLKLKDYPRAQQALETGVKLNPDDSKAHYNLAVLYARLKDNRRAEEEMGIVERLKNAGKGGEQEVYVLAPSAGRPR